MGIFDFIKSQFIEVIEWTDTTTDTVVYRFPVRGQEIKMGAQLTVRESQTAIFVNEGQIADVFTPGRYELSTQNMPVMTKLRSWKYGFNSPFKAEVYFVNTKQFTDQKWGTPNPIMMRDPEFGVIRLRAFGNYSFRVTDAVKFLKEIFGTNSVFETENITGQLRTTIVSSISDLLAELKVAALDLAMHYDELGTNAAQKLQAKFGNYGLEITSLIVENISLPEEVEKVLDKRTSMGILGNNLQQYTQYQAAEAIRDAAQNPGGGLASAGAGIGAGAAIGNIMGEAFRGMNAQQAIPNAQAVPNTPVSPTPAAAILCPHCQAHLPVGVKFCSACGQPLTPPKVKCVKCSFELDPTAKFCPECGAAQIIEHQCTQCGKKLPAGTKFCPECGAKIQ